MPNIRHDGTTRPLVQEDGAGGHTPIVALSGRLLDLLPEVVIDADGTYYGSGGAAGVTDLAQFSLLTLRWIVSDKALAGGGGVNIYLQYSPDAGETWDDLVAFTLVSNISVDPGTYVCHLNALAALPPNAFRAARDATLDAGSFAETPWSDRLRVKLVASGFGVNDTVTLALKGYAQ